MATPEEQAEAAFVDGATLGPGAGDSIDAAFTTSKDQAEEKGKKEGGEDKLKSAFLISGVAVAVIGAIFAIVKKIKEGASTPTSV